MSSKTQIIDGKALAEEIKQQIGQEIVAKKLQPSLAVVLVGEDPASKIYVKLKQKACQKLGIEFHSYILEEDSTTEEVVKVINFLNNDPQIDALLVQLPLPSHLDKEKILSTIMPKKDVDCLTPTIIEKILKGQSTITPPLTQGIIHLLKSTSQDLTNKKVCLILKNDILTQTLKNALKNQNFSVEAIKPSDPELSQKTKKADIIITAVGEPFFIKKEMVKKGVIIIDVGINKVADNITVGDVDYSEVFPKCSFITPVPGGVGPMTVAMLLKNTVWVCKNK